MNKISGAIPVAALQQMRRQLVDGSKTKGISSMLSGKVKDKVLKREFYQGYHPSGPINYKVAMVSDLSRMNEFTDNYSISNKGDDNSNSLTPTMVAAASGLAGTAAMIANQRDMQDRDLHTKYLAMTADKKKTFVNNILSGRENSMEPSKRLLKKIKIISKTVK